MSIVSPSAPNGEKNRRDLRRAAELIRDRAEAVPPEGLADWWFDAEAPDLAHMRKSDREQIATFAHPAVARAVATWLDAAADAPGWDVADLSWLFDYELAVAYAYLGDAA